MAIQAHNGKHSALEMLSEEAGYLGMSAKSLAEHIIVERGLHEARVMRAHAKRAKAGVWLPQLSGDAIFDAERSICAEIVGELHGSAAGART